jgi:hypothetical protein
MNEVIYTVGYSTYPVDEFIRIGAIFEIEQVVDVRKVPKSRQTLLLMNKNCGRNFASIPSNISRWKD